jgi:hypothetical protein
VNVNVSDALAIKPVPLNIAEYFLGLRNRCGRKLLEQFQNQCTICQVTAGNLAHHKRMHYRVPAFELIGEHSITPAKVIDPHRCVYENQVLVPWRRRGATLSSGWLPPSFANRRALSRSISALRPSCNNVERSREPVSLIAFASKLSSRLTVVRIGTSIRLHQ